MELIGTKRVTSMVVIADDVEPHGDADTLIIEEAPIDGSYEFFSIISICILVVFLSIVYVLLRDGKRILARS